MPHSPAFKTQVATATAKRQHLRLMRAGGQGYAHGLWNMAQKYPPFVWADMVAEHATAIPESISVLKAKLEPGGGRS